MSCELIIMSSNSESENEEICGKKRTRNVKLWKINKRKCARQCGESYVSTSGNIVPEKKTGPPCTYDYITYLLNFQTYVFLDSSQVQTEMYE